MYVYIYIYTHARVVKNTPGGNSGVQCILCTAQMYKGKEGNRSWRGGARSSVGYLVPDNMVVFTLKSRGLFYRWLAVGLIVIVTLLLKKIEE